MAATRPKPSSPTTEDFAKIAAIFGGQWEPTADGGIGIKLGNPPSRPRQSWTIKGAHGWRPASSGEIAGALRFHGGTARESRGAAPGRTRGSRRGASTRSSSRGGDSGDSDGSSGEGDGDPPRRPLELRYRERVQVERLRRALANSREPEQLELEGLAA